MLSALPTRPGPVNAFEKAWEACIREIYGDSRSPRAARQWFLIGANSLFEVLDFMAENLKDEAEDETGERLNELRQHLRAACRKAVAARATFFWGPN